MLSIGDQVGRYRLEAKLGEGGMGVVYRATDTELGQPAALKIVRPELSGNPEWRKRFAHEARAASRLDHPNIVRVHEVGCERGLDYISMEYLEGETLDQKIARRPLGVREALRHAIDIADAIWAAHGAGVVHRDLKPANVFITGDGTIKLLDFGLAKFTEAAGTGDFAATVTLSTEAGQILGTVCYMSPEQAEGRAVDARTDIFSIGSLLYEMITGQRAFAGESSLAAILREQPKPASEIAPSISPALDEVIGKCLQKQAGRRYASMGELKAALEAQLRAERARRVPWRMRRWSTWTGLGVAGSAGFVLMRWLSSHFGAADIYLVCFLVGFAFSVVAAFSGSLHLHHAHIGGLHDVPTGDYLQTDSGSPGSGSISPFNGGAIAAFLVWFGGAGYILAGHFGLALPSTYLAAAASGVAGAALLFVFVTRVLLAHDEPLNPADYEMAGVKGRLSSGIREAGTGEMIFSQAGTRRAIAARSVTGSPIPRDSRLIVVRHERGIAYVRELSE